MNYKKRYKKAIERAKYLKTNTDNVGALDVSTCFEFIFPELKESEDEKIRKSLIKSFTNQHSSNFPTPEGFERKDILAWLEKQGKEKPANEVKPKFKVGDWVIVQDKTLYQIKQVIELSHNHYQYWTTNEHWFGDGTKARLWTIQDAKDGNVLNSTRVQATVIFKSFNHDCKHIDAYCALQSGIFIHQEMLWDRDFEPTPKVWENKLFEAMKEAGYEWDAEKKELKKIPNALEECEIEHIEHGKYYYCIKDYYSGGYKRASKGEVVQALRGMSMMALGVKANEYFIPVKCIVDVKPAWSEEDESMLTRCIGILGKCYMRELPNKVEEELIWLKSIKSKIQSK